MDLRLFGSDKQTRVLVLLAMLESTHPLELARLSGVSRTAVDSYLDRLEEDGVIVSARQGRNRRVSINPRFRYRNRLIELLKEIGFGSPAVMSALSTLRRRPRRKGKTLWPAT
jgi:DNA-binding transcriptional ArsR family regulator